MKHIRIQTTDSRISDLAFRADDEVYFTTNRSVYFAKGKQLQKVYDYPPQHHSLCMNMHLPNKTYMAYPPYAAPVLMQNGLLFGVNEGNKLILMQYGYDHHCISQKKMDLYGDRLFASGSGKLFLLWRRDTLARDHIYVSGLDENIESDWTTEIGEVINGGIYPLHHSVLMTCYYEKQYGLYQLFEDGSYRKIIDLGVFGTEPYLDHAFYSYQIQKIGNKIYVYEKTFFSDTFDIQELEIVNPDELIVYKKTLRYYLDTPMFAPQFAMNNMGYGILFLKDFSAGCISTILSAKIQEETLVSDTPLYSARHQDIKKSKASTPPFIMDDQSIVTLWGGGLTAHFFGVLQNKAMKFYRIAPDIYHINRYKNIVYATGLDQNGNVQIDYFQL